jgi:hypothetical protein
MDVNAGGIFWIADSPARRARGVFRATTGVKPGASLDANLVSDPRVTPFVNTDGTSRGFAVSAQPARSVASFLPVTLHGQLDTGKLVTLLDAQNYGGAGNFTPRYRAAAAVLGAHVAEDQHYSSVRFKPDRPHWTAHLTDGQSSVVEDDQSLLSVEESADGNWLVYESATPITLRQIEIRVTSACLALLHLALYFEENRNTRETEVRIGPSDPWLTAYGPAFYAEQGNFEHETLLTREHLTIERFAAWIALHDTLDGLTWVIARPSTGAVQTRILMLTPLVEGFHRRLPNYEQAKFPGTSKSALSEILRSARDAAVPQAEAAGLEQQQVSDAIIFLTEVSFQSRADAIVAEVCAVIPEIAESIPDLPRRIKKARNDLAHHLARKAPAPLRTRALEWLVVAEATSWLLRCLLLLRAGFEPETVRARLLLFQRFGFFRANTAQHVLELGWDTRRAPS